MSCDNCNWYSADRKVCIKKGTIQLEGMPVCEEFIEDETLNKVFIHMAEELEQ